MLGVESHEHGSILSVIAMTNEDMRNKNQSEMVTIVQEKNVATIIYGIKRIMLSHGSSGRRRCEWLE